MNECIHGNQCFFLIIADLEVVVESESTESLEGMKDPDNVSYTAPLSPKEKTTDI